MTGVELTGPAHPKPTELALYATADLPCVHRWRVRLHVRRCVACEQQLSEIRHAVAEWQSGQQQRLASSEGHADWTLLEREMIGNIAVGLAAARCIERIGVRTHLVWRGILIALALSILFVLGWITHIPREQTGHLARSIAELFQPGGLQNDRPVVRADSTSLAVGPSGKGLVLLHPAAGNTTARGDNSVEVRYLDDDTGQVTVLRLSSAPSYGPH